MGYSTGGAKPRMAPIRAPEAAALLPLGVLGVRIGKRRTVTAVKTKDGWIGAEAWLRQRDRAALFTAAIPAIVEGGYRINAQLYGLEFEALTVSVPVGALLIATALGLAAADVLTAKAHWAEAKRLSDEAGAEASLAQFQAGAAAGAAFGAGEPSPPLPAPSERVRELQAKAVAEAEAAVWSLASAVGWVAAVVLPFGSIYLLWRFYRLLFKGIEGFINEFADEGAVLAGVLLPGVGPGAFAPPASTSAG